MPQLAEACSLALQTIGMCRCLYTWHGDGKYTVKAAIFWLVPGFRGLELENEGMAHATTEDTQTHPSRHPSPEWLQTATHYLQCRRSAVLQAITKGNTDID